MLKILNPKQIQIQNEIFIEYLLRLDHLAT
jgi:hypothetical protein